MRRTMFIFATIAAAAACTDYSGPSGPYSVYALARVGIQHLPVTLNNGHPTLLLADTFRLAQDRSRLDGQILRQTTVIQDGPGGKIEKSNAEFAYRIENGTLTYDNCPLGTFCIASLVYAPRSFQIVGDSLFEVVPISFHTPPHVYGLVRRQ